MAAAARYEYQFTNYSFQTTERAQSAQASIDSMAAAGWRVHTASMNGYVEVSLLWERLALSSKPAA